eukprot:Skav216411  [mRNA]  locus=scaffold457:505243:510709:+ [translate_table: standard]
MAVVLPIHINVDAAEEQAPTGSEVANSEAKAIGIPPAEEAELPIKSADNISGTKKEPTLLTKKESTSPIKKGSNSPAKRDFVSPMEVTVTLNTDDAEHNEHVEQKNLEEQSQHEGYPGGWKVRRAGRVHSSRTIAEPEANQKPRRSFRLGSVHGGPAPWKQAPAPEEGEWHLRASHWRDQGGPKVFLLDVVRDPIASTHEEQRGARQQHEPEVSCLKRGGGETMVPARRPTCGKRWVMWAGGMCVEWGATKLSWWMLVVYRWPTGLIGLFEWWTGTSFQTPTVPSAGASENYFNIIYAVLEHAGKAARSVIGGFDEPKLGASIILIERLARDEDRGPTARW